jgi:hypothetical protein
VNVTNNDTGAASEEPADETSRSWPVGVNPDAPPLVREAAAAYFAELDELLVHLAAHPAERWVAYYGSRRIGFGSNHPQFHRECQEKFPDGQFRIYRIDEANKYLEDTELLSPPPTDWFSQAE